MSEAEVRTQFKVNLSDKPLWISEDLVFLGEIPRKFSFELDESQERERSF